MALVAPGVGLIGASPATAAWATSAEQQCHRDGSDVRLTFDDGGRPEQVTAILDTLAAEGVRAGFFPTGDWARRNPSLVERMQAEGHWLGNHTKTHRRLTGASDAVVRQEIAEGVASDVLRPPEGAFDNRVRQIAASMGYKLCLWSVDPRDWSGVSAQEVVRRVCSEIQPGGVPVLHLQSNATIHGLGELIRCVRNRSLALEPLQRHAGAALDQATGGAAWVTPSGVIHTRQMAHFGQPAPLRAGRHAVDVEVARAAGGYWVASHDGGVFAYGAAPFLGSMGGQPLAAPIIDMSASPSRRGYWLAATDGGVFAFGEAGFHGSTGHIRVNQPITAMASTPSGDGYWLLGADGGVFTFGDAAFHGSAAGTLARGRAMAITSTEAGDGYWVLGSDGAVFSYGAARFHGAQPAGVLALALTGDATGDSYTILRDDVTAQRFAGP